MGIGKFRREVQRWLNGYLFSAEQDAESESRMPTDVDPANIIDQRVVDAVEESLLDLEPRHRSHIQQQAPLNESEMTAISGLGYNLLRDSMTNGGQEIMPLAHVPRRDHFISPAPEAATASNTVNADFATVAEQVIQIVEEPPTCRICLEPESELSGPLVPCGVVCDHVFHLQCITRWASYSREDWQSCPVCRQGLTLEAQGIITPERVTTSSLSSQTSGSIDVASFVTGDAFALERLRRSTIEEHRSFINQLGLVSRLQTPVHGPGSELLRPEEATCFAERWVSKPPDRRKLLFQRLYQACYSTRNVSKHGHILV